MRTKTTTKAALALTAALTWTAPDALAQNDKGVNVNEATAGVLASLIDPTPAGAVQEDAPSEEEMKRVVSELISTGHGDRIEVFGESAGPALRAIVEGSTLTVLTRTGSQTPLYHFVRYAPNEALRYYSELQSTQRFKYEAIVRGEFGPASLLNWLDAKGPIRDLYLDLMDRTIAMESIALDRRASIAARSLAYGLETPASRALVKENAHLVIGNNGHRTAVLRLVVPPGTTPPADIHSRIAYYLLDSRPTIEVYEGLSKAPSAETRSKLASSIYNSWSGAQLPADRTVSVLSTLLADTDADVIYNTLQAVSQVLNSDSYRLDVTVLTELVAAIASKTDVNSNVCNSVAQTMHRTVELEVDGSIEAVSALYRAAFDAPNPRLHSALIRNRYPNVSIDRALAMYEAGASTSNEIRDSMLGVVTTSVRRVAAPAPERSSALLDALASPLIGPRETEQILSQSTHESGSLDSTWNNNPRKRLAFASLPPERVVDAIRVVVASEGRLDRIGFTSCVRWDDAGTELRTHRDDASASSREQLFAGGSLVMCGAGTDADASKFAKLVVGLLGTPAGRADVEWYFDNRGSGVEAGASKLWNLVTAQLLEEARFPDDLADDLSFTRGAETREQRDVTRRVLIAAERRATANSDLRFGNIAYYGLEAMADDITLLQPTLLRGWVSRERGFYQAGVTVVLATDDAEWIRFTLNSLLAQLASETYIGRQKPVADQILRLPGDEPVQRLLEQVTRTGSPDLVSHVEQRVAELLRIREASIRWSQLASGGTDVDGAKARVLLLLDSPNADVRVEAIRGLGTLGAVEALPRLIEIVGSGSDAEKEAAKSTLDLLHRRAASQLERSEGGQSGD